MEAPVGSSHALRPGPRVPCFCPHTLASLSLETIPDPGEPGKGHLVEGCRADWLSAEPGSPFQGHLLSEGSGRTPGVTFSTRSAQAGWRAVIILSVVLHVFHQADCPAENVTASKMPGIISLLWKVTLHFLNLSITFDENLWTALVKTVLTTVTWAGQESRPLVQPTLLWESHTKFLGPEEDPQSWARGRFPTISVGFGSLSSMVHNARGFPGGSDGKASACNAGDPGSIPGLGRSLEKEMATHSKTLGWKIPWMEEPGRLQSMGSQSRTRLSDFTFTSCTVK